MKVFVYNYRDFDEAEHFTRFSREMNIELGICRETPSLENAELASGYEAISIITTQIDAALERVLKFIPAICTPHFAVYLLQIQLA